MMHRECEPLAVRSCRRPAARRRGFSLVEMLSIIGLIGTLLSLSAATLHRAYQVHHAALDNFRQLEQLNFWCQRWRDDVHQAVAYRLQPQLELRLTEEREVHYHLEQGQLVRSAFRDSQRVTRETLSGTTFLAVQWQEATPQQASPEASPSSRELLACHLQFHPQHGEPQPLLWLAQVGGGSDRKSDAGESDGVTRPGGGSDDNE